MINYFSKRKRKKILIISLIVIAVLVALFGIMMLIRSRLANEKNITASDQTQQYYDRNMHNEIKALNATYEDAIAWICIPNTKIDAPIFKGKDNETYFSKNREGEDIKYGELFMDYRCNINNMDNMSHFIVYGHNTEDEKYFSELLNYKDISYFNNHKMIEMSTINGNYKWEIFSVYKTTPDFFYIDVQFKDNDEYYEFLKSLKEKSIYNTNVDISKDDTILTLSTCDYTIDDGRFVVQAKLVKN